MPARGAQTETLVTFDTVGATGATAYAREALCKPHVAANGLAPLAPISSAKTRFSCPYGTLKRTRRQFVTVGPTLRPTVLRNQKPYPQLEKTEKVIRKRSALNPNSKHANKTERKKGCNTRTSQGVTHPSTTLAQARLTAEF